VGILLVLEIAFTIAVEDTTRPEIITLVSVADINVFYTWDQIIFEY
jgi:hypothetical protein